MHNNCKFKFFIFKCSYQIFKCIVNKTWLGLPNTKINSILMTLPDLLLVEIYVALSKSVKLHRLPPSPAESREISENSPYGKATLAVSFSLILSSCEL